MIKPDISSAPLSGGHLAIDDATRAARCQLRALDGMAAPAARMLKIAFGMYETQSSAEMDGIMTTQQDLYEFQLIPGGEDAEARAARYCRAMDEGWREVADNAVLPLDAVVRIRQTITNSGTRWRRAPLADAPSPRLIAPMMGQLESQMHKQSDTDPLVRMATIHHKLRSIQPFDSACNGTGRVVNMLFLQKEGLLRAPVLYLSAYLNRTQRIYYRLLRGGCGREWLLYMLGGIRITAEHAAQTATRIIAAHGKAKREIVGYLRYREDLADAIFTYPYITAGVLSRELETSPEQAREYLDDLRDEGMLQRMHAHGVDIYINLAVMDIIFTQPEIPTG